MLKDERLTLVLTLAVLLWLCPGLRVAALRDRVQHARLRSGKQAS